MPGNLHRTYDDLASWKRRHSMSGMTQMIASGGPPTIEDDYFEPVSSEVWPLDKDEFWTRAEPIEFDPWEPVPTPSTKADEQRLWAPVVGFIRSLHGLRDVDYQCNGPRSIFATIW